MNLDFFKKNNKKIFLGVAIFIFLIGVFLRTYNFRDWLYFYPDQARDVFLAEKAVNGHSGWPLLGPIAASTKFRLGPIYYYFQIISGKIFGITPVAMAYPDLLFSILSIPLFYYFMRRYFGANMSLALAGLYAMSFYDIRYSRFAWNSNPIPFFVILFLISLSELLFSRSRTKWYWIAGLGISLGVSVQLHTVLLVMLPIMVLMALAFSIKKDPKLWRKWLIVFLIASILNGGQIYSELQTGFSNTKYFFSVLNDRSPHKGSGILENVELDAICHGQAGTHFLSSLDNQDGCQSFSDFKDAGTALSLWIGMIFMFFGYVAMAYLWKEEKNEQKKIFLGLLFVFGLVNFLTLVPIISHNGQLRYLFQIIFMPFIFLGFLAMFLRRRGYAWMVAVLFVFLIAANFSTIISEAEKYAAKDRSDATYVVLGEIEPIGKYMAAQSAPKKKIYLAGGYKYMQNYFKPLSYVGDEIGVKFLRVSKRVPPPVGQAVFYIDQSWNGGKDKIASPVGTELRNYIVESYQGFGQVGIYKLKN